MGWQFNVCYILRLYYDWDVIATDYKAGPYIVYNTFPAGKKSNKARCVCLSFRFVPDTCSSSSYPFFLFMEKGEEYYKRLVYCKSIGNVGRSTGGHNNIARRARVKREFPFFFFLIFLFLQKKINEEEADVFSTPGEISDKKQFRELLYSISFRQEERRRQRRKKKRNKSLGIRFTFVPPS